MPTSDWFAIHCPREREAGHTMEIGNTQHTHNFKLARVRHGAKAQATEM
jgi:hypothetical protein